MKEKVVGLALATSDRPTDRPGLALIEAEVATQTDVLFLPAQPAGLGIYSHGSYTETADGARVRGRKEETRTTILLRHSHDSGLYIYSGGAPGTRTTPSILPSPATGDIKQVPNIESTRQWTPPQKDCRPDDRGESEKLYLLIFCYLSPFLALLLFELFLLRQRCPTDSLVRTSAPP